MNFVDGVKTEQKLDSLDESFPIAKFPISLRNELHKISNDDGNRWKNSSQNVREMRNRVERGGPYLSRIWPERRGARRRRTPHTRHAFHTHTTDGREGRERGFHPPSLGL